MDKQQLQQLLAAGLQRNRITGTSASNAATSQPAQTPAGMQSGNSSNNPSMLFPFVLHGLLQDLAKFGNLGTEIISWSPDGKSFRMHNERLMTSSILKTYF